MTALYESEWEPLGCFECQKEKAEFVDGKVQCLTKGYCKYLNNWGPDKRIQGHLMWRCGVGLEKFLQVASVVAHTCPSDPNGYHTAPASDVMALPYKVDMSGELFWDMMAIYINKLNKNISSDRARQQRELEIKRRK